MKGGVVRVERFARPEVNAATYWLNNRSEHWQSRSAITGGKRDGQDLPIGLKVESRNEIIAGILALVASKPDGKNKPEKDR